MNKTYGIILLLTLAMSTIKIQATNREDHNQRKVLLALEKKPTHQAICLAIEFGLEPRHKKITSIMHRDLTAIAILTTQKETKKTETKTLLKK
jgi:hypothetical protein